MLSEIRYAVRVLLKQPGFTLVALATLALGIGANTAVFSIVNAALLRPMPGIAEPDRLVSLYRSQANDTFDNLGYPDYADYRDRNHTLAEVAAHSATALSFSYGTAERVRGDGVTPNYFRALGVEPAVGRFFAADDYAAAVLSYAFWQRKFAGDRQIAGRQVALNGYPFTVVGVAPRGFAGTVPAAAFDVWVPLAAQPIVMPRLSSGILQNRASGWLEVFGRLRPQVVFGQAEADVRTIAGQLAQEYPLTNANRSINLAAGVGLYPDGRAEISGILRLLAAAVGLLLLITCANVAGLFLVRASGRQREIAVRIAVGAGRARVVRQLMTEGMVLALAAGALGLALASWTAQLAAGVRTPAAAFAGLDTGIDARVLAFTLAASLAAGMLFALLPALRSLPADLTTPLKNGTSGAGFRRARVQAALVASQVAISFLLLTGSALLLRSLQRVLTASPGFEIRRIAMASIDLNTLRYPPERVAATYSRLLEKLAASPGVVSATLAWTVPPRDLSGRVSIFYPGQEPAMELLRGGDFSPAFQHGFRVDLNTVAPAYFRTLGIALLRGRDFTERDAAGGPGVVIMSQRLAERLWPGQDPIGRRIAWPNADAPGSRGAMAPATFEVVGVAADTRYRSLILDPPLLLYAPVLQRVDARTTVVVRTAGDPAPAFAAIQSALAAIDKDAAAFAPETMAEHIDASLWQQREAAGWISALGVMALALAGIGLYGVIAQSVAQRRRELGIRLALGAPPESVARLVVGQGMRLTAVGLAVGTPLAWVFARAMRGLVAGIGAADPWSVAGSAAALAAAMLMAAWIPARRAARVDPAEALRCE